MANAKQTTTKATKAAKPAQAPTPAPVAQAPAPVAQAPAPAPTPTPTVALRGGPAVAQVQLTGKPYRTGAKHNAQWWAAVQAACAAGPAPVATLTAAPHSVPTHFVGYAMRRGYLQAVA